MNSMKAAQLRATFDRAFAVEPETGTFDTIDLLAISLSGAPYALPLTAVSSLHAHKKITRIPVQATGLLGVAGFRGVILPVYDLGALIGAPAAATPHWLAMMAKEGVAIAFETFDGHLRLPKDALVANESAEGGRQHLSHLIRTGDVLRGVIDLATALRPILGHD